MKMNTMDWVAYILVIIGGLNWSLIGIFRFDVVGYIFGSMIMVSRLIYILVGLSAIYLLVTSGKMAKR
jgi:hypothetical protein